MGNVLFNYLGNGVSEDLREEIARQGKFQTGFQSRCIMKRSLIFFSHKIQCLFQLTVQNTY